MVTAGAGIESAGRRPVGERLASPRSRAAVIGRAEAGKDGGSLRRSVSVMTRRPAARERPPPLYGGKKKIPETLGTLIQVGHLK